MDNTKLFESIFNEASKARISEDVITGGHIGIEVNLNGWKVANANFPRSGRPIEFTTEDEAKNSEFYQNLVQRYGQDRVRTFIQRAA